MNYCFYMKKVAQLPADLLSRLLELAKTTPLDPSTSFFRPGRHPGMVSGGWSIMQNPSAVQKDVQEVLALLDSVLPKNAALSYTLNLLAGGGVINEHTDASPGPAHRGHLVNVHHLVHVSLSGGASYGFRRDRKSDWERLEMEAGGVYVYNNYVWHMVENRHRADDRYNMILFYNDPEWTIKQSLYTRYGFPLGGY